MSLTREPGGRTDGVGDRLTYRTRRRWQRAGTGGSLSLEVGEALGEHPGATEVFLTARFGLHTTVAGRTWW
ncbi:hypothetical protein ACS229_30270, partial [Klebsiella pneumoniae]|uniref:hypothetical protein n=1 Tax=Klebsiella pneumoniae TaxID=573 RepID=UPI003F1FD8D2